MRIKNQSMQTDLELIMGGISFSREGVTAHITADGEFLNDKQAQQCDLCFEPFNRIDLIRIVDDRLSICRVCIRFLTLQ